jgi:hypothetical protein
MLARLLFGCDPQERWRRMALLCAMLVGIGLRFYNYAIRPPSLWQDEAYWAMKVLRTEAIEAQIRPLGFMLVTQGLVHSLSVAAWVYRLLPFIASLVAMLLAPYVAVRLFRSVWAQVFSVLLLAVSPVLLEMAVEFKHYGCEVGVYVAVLAAFLNHRERQTFRSLALLLGLGWFSFFFSITVIFLYPVVFGTLLWDAFKRKHWRRLIATGAVALVCVGTITTIYFTTWRGIKTQKAEKKWGTSYDVFYVKNGPHNQYGSRLSWSTAKYFELAAVTDIGRTLWKSERIAPARLDRMKQVDWALWSLLHLAGIAYLIGRRRYVELLALWTPLLFLTAFNLAGRWPAGAFRTNTFYAPLAAFLGCFAIEWLAQLPARLNFVAPSVASLLLIPTLYFRPALTEKGLWAKPGNFTAALRMLPETPAKSQHTLILDYASCRPWDYYTIYDAPLAELGPKLRRKYRMSCKRRTQEIRAEMARLATKKRGFWMLMTDSRKFEVIQEYAKRYCTKVETSFTRDRYHMLLRCERGK